MLKLMLENFEDELKTTYDFIKDDKNSKGANETYFIAKYDVMHDAIRELIDSGISSYYTIYQFQKKFSIDLKELKELKQEIRNRCY